MVNKKIPMRMCIGCGEMKPKRELIRVVKPREGDPVLDLTGKAAGRGAYLCRSTDCLKAAQKRRSLEKSFSCRVAPEVYEVMLHELAEADGNS
ncbi:MAG: YlxR family protein [Oscillospiraceae bacterium]|nr:YlxR family protein [Oscillospiraceae bacterium]MBQ9696116.1 YlxR family protein [Oscillospiraceae bacterium]MBR1459345.1 YlxR family protein [Oscillospiraceae bacterium]MBR1897623.1 YlxR family protein [Oscillospiraceae bacterium]